jgi:hypothetical protein
MFSIIISTIKGREEAYKNLCDSIAKYTQDYEIVTHKDWEGPSIPIAEAWNNCTKKSKGEFLVFLNDDMLVTEGWANEQFKMYKNFPLIGSLAFKVYDDLGNVQSRGHSFNGLQPYLPEEDVLVVDYSDHPFMSRRVFERTGGFTAHGQMYYEDADMGLKIQTLGLFNYYNKNAILHHQTIGLRVGTDKDKEKRKYNEQVVQQQSKVKFFESWGEYLKNRLTR